MTPEQARNSLSRSASDWMKQSECSEDTAHLFYSFDNREKEQAKKLCGACAVQSECLNFAISIREDHGIWGGMEEDERRRILVRRSGGEARAS